METVRHGLRLAAGAPPSATPPTAKSDTVFGGSGDDVVRTRFGDDVLDGGPGIDALHGGPGTDTCTNGEMLFARP